MGMMAETFRYNVRDAGGSLLNTILWDGATAFDPGPGCTLELAHPDPIIVDDSVHQVFDVVTEELVEQVDDPASPDSADFPFSNHVMATLAGLAAGGLGAVVVHVLS